MKISHIILLGFFFILLLFSITTFINYRQSEKVNENTEKFASSSSILRQGNRLQRNIFNMVSGLRGYLITSEPSFIQTYDSARNENVEILTELAAEIRTNSPQQKLVTELDALNTRWINEFATPLIEAKKAAALSDSSAASFTKFYRAQLTSGIEKALLQDFQRKFKDFSNREYAFREAQKETLTASIEQTKTISFVLTTISVIIGVGIAIILASHISSRILKMVRMADSIAQGNYKVNMEDKRSDELSGLARSLNNMAQVLSENISLLQRKNEELNQFAHIVAHDLKAPLRGIDNVVTWIEEDHSLDLPAKVQEYLSLVKGRIVRAENLLNGILSYSRIGREVQHKEVVHLTELFDEIRTYLPSKTGITLMIQPGMPDLFTERLPLFQVFSNLIINAFKYHDKPHGHVKVYFKTHAKYYEFFVEDNGPGIAKSYHEKIFMIFQTLQARDSFESTGVGLAIVRKILHDRKLSIEVLSEPGKGSTFAFTWPKYEYPADE
jgi:signal transduction histidine kinase